MPVPKRKDGRTSAVLFLSREWAGWYGPGPDGRPVLGSAAVLGEGPQDLAQAAVEAVRDAGAKPRPCVLALGSGLVAHRLTKLPAIGRKDLRRVFPRKAAALIEGDPKDVLYAALPMGDEAAVGADEAGENDWLILAQDRKEAIELRLALRNVKIKVRRVVVSRLARLCRAQEMRGDAEGACVVIDVTHREVVTSLIAGERLVQENRLTGDFFDTPAMAMPLVQDVRGLDAFWRRTHRGGRVGQVVIIGLDPERAGSLANAISSSLPDAEVIPLPQAEDGEELPPEAGRWEAMAACLADGPFNVDLTVHVPARHAFLVALVGCLLLVTVGLGSILHGELSRELRGLRENARATLAQSDRLEEVVARNDEAAAVVDEVNLELERVLRAGSIGIPLEQCLRDGLAAFGNEASITALSIGPDEDGGEVTIAAVTGSHPVRAMQVLARVGARLEDSPSYEFVDVEPPSTLAPDGESGGDSIAFVVTGWREGAP